MNWSWQQEGFDAAPRAITAPQGLLLFRAWGGAASKMGSPTRPGVCLSTQRPSTRTEAERLFSAWEWGNSCIWLTEFRTAPGTTLHVGHVDAGQVLDLRLISLRKGVQVFVENAAHAKLFEMGTTRLVDDLGGRYIAAGSRATH